MTKSNFEKQNETKQERKEKDKISRETLGKYFYDLSKLSFGAMVLGVGVPWFSDTKDNSLGILFLLGIATTAFWAYLGFKILKR